MSNPQQRRFLCSANRTRRRYALLRTCSYAALACAISGSNASPAWAQLENSGVASAVHWSRSELVIPFQVDATGEIPAEVRLEVSEDQGRTWKLYTRADARTRQFRYRAKNDGEIRFRLKTVDRNGNVYDNPGEPLVVIIDTTKPAGELLVDVDSQGAMLAECVIKDAALDSSTVKLEYQTDVHHQWTSIPCEVRQGKEAGEWIAFGTWEMPSEAAQLVVRVMVRDRAGNTSEWTRMPRLPRSAGASREMRLASNQDPSSGSMRIGTSMLRFPETPLYQQPSDLNKKPQEPQVPQVQVSEAPKKEVLGGPAPRIEPRASKVPETLIVSGDAKQLTSSQSLGAERTTNVAVASKENGSRVEALYSNSRIFSLDYAIDNDPGAAVTNIELWGTVDRGESWERWGVDSDRQSPMDVEVLGDGLFGFRMVIVGANGIASRRPLPGDDADAWIRVDTQLPACRIISVLNGKGTDAGSLVIEYAATDDFFGDRPISFACAPSPQGPWQSIAQGARNNGRYVWTPDPGLPSTVYLRMQTVDAAGNISVHQLDLPVEVHAATPKGRIQGFRPQR